MLPVEESLLLSSDELLSKEESCELSVETMLLLSVELSTKESLSLVEAWIEFSELLSKRLLSVELSTEDELVLVEESIEGAELSTEEALSLVEDWVEVAELLAERLLSFEDELPSTVKLQAASAVMERVAATAHNKVISFLTFLIINSF